MKTTRRSLASLTLLPLMAIIPSVMATGCTADVGDEAEQAEQDLVTGRTRLRLAAFIPCDAVDTMGLYDGDGRSFSHDGAAKSSRVMLDVVVDPNGEDTSERHMFPSKKFDKSAIQSKDGWCVTLKDGAQPTKTKTANGDRVYSLIREDARTEKLGSQNFSVTQVQLEAHAKNPLIPFGLAPNTDATVLVEIFYPLSSSGVKGSPTWLVWAGSHDAFPSWELYADRQPVFQYDVREAGKGPFDLLPFGKPKTSGVCERKASRWSCEERD